MKKIYLQPEITAAQFEPMTLMQTTSPVGDYFGINNAPTDMQW